MARKQRMSEFQKLVRAEARQLRAHFEEYGWDIRPDFNSTVLNYFGFDPVMETLKQLPPGIEYAWVEKEKSHPFFGLRWSAAHEFIVYDAKLDKFHSCKPGEQIHRYSDEDRYVWLGVFEKEGQEKRLKNPASVVLTADGWALERVK